MIITRIVGCLFGKVLQLWENKRRVIKEKFKNMDSISIDYGILERIMRFFLY